MVLYICYFNTHGSECDSIIITRHQYVYCMGTFRGLASLPKLCLQLMFKPTNIALKIELIFQVYKLCCDALDHCKTLFEIAKPANVTQTPPESSKVPTSVPSSKASLGKKFYSI